MANSAASSCRRVHLNLSTRWATMLLTLCRNEKKKRTRQRAKSTFVPRPGQYDVNLMRIEVMDRIINDIERQLKEPR